MWLIKLHAQVSVLCAISIFGVFAVYWKSIVKNGWAQGDGKKRGLFMRFVRFLKAFLLLLITSAIPFVNIATVLKVWTMATQTKESADNADA